MLLGSFHYIRMTNRTSLVNHWPNKDGCRSNTLYVGDFGTLDVASSLHPLTSRYSGGFIPSLTSLQLWNTVTWRESRPLGGFLWPLRCTHRLLLQLQQIKKTAHELWPLLTSWDLLVFDQQASSLSRSAQKDAFMASVGLGFLFFNISRINGCKRWC